MKQLSIYLFWAVFMFVVSSCNTDPLNPDDYKDENEIRDNEIVLSENTISLDETDSKEIINVFDNRIIVSKNAKFIKNLVPGMIIFKNNLVEPDSITLYRKVVEIVERPNNFLIFTEHAGLAETFYKYTLDTRSDKFSVRPRTVFDEYIKFDTPIGGVNGSLNFQPDIDLNISADDFIFTSSFDSADVVNGTVQPPSFDMQIKNFVAQVSGKFLMNASANISVDTPVIKEKVLLRIPEFGLALYMDVALEVSGSLSGEIESPVEQFTFGGYDLRLQYDYTQGDPTYRLGPSNIPVSPASDQEWIIHTDGNVEIRLKASFFIGIFGAPDLAKIGFNIGGYFNPGIHHSGNIADPSPGYNLNFEAGIVGNVYAEFAFFFDSTVEFAGPDIKFPLLTKYIVIPFCNAFDGVTFQFDAATQDFRLRVGNSDPSRSFYKVYVNGNALAQLGNEVFDYNKDYVVQVPVSNSPVNEVIISDFFQSGCYIKDNFVNPGGFGSCSEVVVDAEGNEYCTVLIGQSLWMSENLRISSAGFPVSTEGSPEERLYGRLYTFDEISGGSLCPSGWHIPSRDEWLDLIDELGGSETAGLNMKYPSSAVWDGNVPNHGSFNAVPSGEYYVWQDKYGFIDKKAFFWSSEVGPFGEVYFYSVSSHLDDVLEDFGNGKYDHSIKDIGYSCRCVKDE
jgi:uncharacterized protein (TIGR02145 family)